MKTNPNDQIKTLTGEDYRVVEVEQQDGFRGLTKREYFATMALQGYISNKIISPKQTAIDVIDYADALIEELNKEK